MKRRLLAIVLAGVLVFSQSGAVLAAENSAAGNTSAEIAAEEEPVQPEEEEETEETEEPVISVQEEEEESAKEETTETEPESAPEEENVEEGGSASEEEAVSEPPGSVSEEAEEPAEKPFAEEEAESASSEIATEVIAEEIIKEAKNAAGNSTVRINDENVEHFVFDNSIWDCSVDVTWLGDGECDLEAVVTDHNGPEDANIEGACYIDDMIHVDGGVLADAGITWVKIAVKLSADDIDEIWSNEVELDVREIYVGGDVYGVDVWTDSGSKRVLRGGTVSMSSQASHEQYDAQSGEYHTCTEDEMTGITYEWSLNIHQDNAREQLCNVITVTPDADDQGKAVVSFET